MTIDMLKIQHHATGRTIMINIVVSFFMFYMLRDILNSNESLFLKVMYVLLLSLNVSLAIYAIANVSS